MDINALNGENVSGCFPEKSEKVIITDYSDENTTLNQNLIAAFTYNQED